MLMNSYYTLSLTKRFVIFLAVIFSGSVTICLGAPPNVTELEKSKVRELSLTSIDSLGSCSALDFSSLPISSHGFGQDQGSAESVENGSAIKISGNSWKSVPLTYTITPNTVLEFEFKSDLMGEYHGIGMSATQNWQDEYAFNLLGTQGFADDIEWTDSTRYNGGYQHYIIPIGQYYTGSVDRVFFLNDHDIAPSDAISYFRNVRVYEEGTCDTLVQEPECPKVPLYLTDFEESIGVWVAEPTSGPATPGSFRSSGGSWAYSGEYFILIQGDGEKSHATTQSLDLSAYSELRFSFTVRFLEHSRIRDGVRLQISTDGGQTFSDINHWTFGNGDLEIVSTYTSNRLFADILVTGEFSSQTQFRLQITEIGARDYITARFDDISIDVCPLDGCSSTSNIALNRTARLSSQYGNGSADLGVDGIRTGTSPWSPDLAHSTREVQPWWEVDLGATSQVDSLIIFNRTDGNWERLQNFHILVSDAPMNDSLDNLLLQPGVESVFFPYKADSIERIFVNAVGRYVRVQLSDENTLHFAEMEVIGCNLEQVCDIPTVEIEAAGPFSEEADPFQLSATPSGGIWSGAVDSSGVFNPSIGIGTYQVIYTYEAFEGCEGSDTLSIEVLPASLVCDNPTNISLNRTARMSSQYGNGVGDLALDGNRVGNSPWSADLTHTTREFQPWWEVDLGGNSLVDTVVIFNRSNGSWGRLRDFYILVSDAPMNDSLDNLLIQPGVTSIFSPGRVDSIGRIPVNAEGRYVRIQLSAENTLHFAEVEVMGCNIDQVCNTPVVSISPAGPFVEGGSTEQLSATPIGGVWSGAVDTSGIFDPSQGVGTYEVIYTYEEFAGCVGADTTYITVNPLGDPCDTTGAVLIDPAGPFAENAGVQTLSASPLGGVWSGSADSNGNFDPSIGQGTYEVIYTYDFNNGCIKADTIEIVVTPVIDPCDTTAAVVLDPAGPFLEDAGIQALTASPLGGVWSGSADSNGNFDPSIGQGTYEVIYTYDFGNGCIKADTIDIVVNQVIDPCDTTAAVVLDPAGPFLEDAGIQALTASPLGGVWSGSADSNGNFDPSIGQGTYEVIYTYDFNNGCIKADTIDIVVNPVIDPCDTTAAVVLDPAGPFLEDAGIQALTASPLGGVWSGSADSNGNFDPSIGQGTYEVIYTYDFNNGCIKADTIDIVVNPVVDPCDTTAAVVLDPAGPFIEDAGVQALTASPLGGVWSGSADSNGNFDPSIGQGTYEVVYTYDFGNGCIKADTIDIVVTPIVDPCAGTDTVFISPAGPFTTDQGIQQLLASPAGGIWSGSANSDGTFDPSQGEGTYSLIYTKDFGNGCIKADTIEVVVDPAVDPCDNTAEVLIDPAGPFVEDAGIQTLTATPQGGVWSGNADSNGNFDPSIGQGTYEVIYTYDFGNGCVKSDTLSIGVNPIVTSCGNPTNIALNRSARMSSQYGNSVAGLGVDGNRVGSSPWSADLAHTTREFQPWWEVDLGGASSVDTLVIFNRSNGSWARLKNFYVLVSDAPMDGSLDDLLLQSGVSNTFFAGKADSIARIPVNVQGRYVRIQLSDENTLHFAEAEVIGCNLEQICVMPSVSIDPAGPFEEGTGLQQLTASPAGGVWSGAVSDSGEFNPSLGVGTYEVIYTYEVFAGCVGADTLMLEVLPSGAVCSTPVNLAQNGTAEQSSTYGNGVAGLAVDGNTIGSSAWTPDLQHTTKELQPWWQIDLGQQSILSEMVLYNRTDCCNGRLKNFYVFVSDSPFSGTSNLDDLIASSSVDHVFFSGAAGLVESISLDGLAGRYVRVQLSATNTLHMAEVEIMGCPEGGGCIDPIVNIDPAGPFSEDAGLQQLTANPIGGIWSGAVASNGLFDPSAGPGNYEVTYTYTDSAGCSSSAVSTIEVQPVGCDSLENLALNKVAEQSSTYGNGVASLANDGNRTGGSPWSADLQHTTVEFQPWWQVNLGAVRNIEQVNIFNRSDCCTGRLRDFYVLVSELAFDPNASLEELLNDSSIKSYSFSGRADSIENIVINTTGRYVRIQQSRQVQLHMAEVEVMGCQAGTATESNRFTQVDSDEFVEDISLELEVFPNPSFGQINFLIKQIDPEEMVEYSLYNLHGQRVWNFVGYKAAEVDLSHLAKGMYILRAQGSNWAKKRQLLLH